jgi:hypothetical protein
LPNEIADPFRQITQWTKEDTGRLQAFLELRGIVVQRPTFESIDNHIDKNDILIKPPITPRDDYLVLGSTLYTNLHNPENKDSWQNILDQYQHQGFDVQAPKNQPINCVAPPSLVRMGRDLYLDIHTHSDAWGYLCEWAVNTSKEYRVNICQTYGHSDSVFCPVAPGLIVSSHYKTNYDQSFPGWEVFKVPGTLNNHITSTWSMYDQNFIAGNKFFDQHILDKASAWVGNFKETVYEVNMLVLDEKNVVAMKDYPPLTKWLDERGITVHFFDLRTRSFWDGGWHCFTLDIHREDTAQDLFPDRGDNGVYWRLK